MTNNEKSSLIAMLLMSAAMSEKLNDIGKPILCDEDKRKKLMEDRFVVQIVIKNLK